MTLIPSLPWSPAGLRVARQCTYLSHTHTHRKLVIWSSTPSEHRLTHPLGICMCKNTYKHTRIPASNMCQERSQPADRLKLRHRHSWLMPALVYTHMHVCGHTMHMSVCSVCVHVCCVCALCARACTIVCVYMHTRTILVYTVKSSPTMCPAGGTGQENHISGIPGLPALSGLLLPVSALRQPQEVSVSLAAKF